jgi:antirestriction protein
MNIEEIQDLWESDSKIDPDNLHSESLKIPSLHSKYYNIYNNILLLKKMEENKYKILKKEKWLYYSGKADPDVYKEHPFDHKVLKPDIDKYMDADTDLMKSVSKVEYYQTMLSFLDSILKTILNRTYQIKNAIEYMRFTAGYG